MFKATTSLGLPKAKSNNTHKIVWRNGSSLISKLIGDPRGSIGTNWVSPFCRWGSKVNIKFVYRVIHIYKYLNDTFKDNNMRKALVAGIIGLGFLGGCGGEYDPTVIVDNTQVSDMKKYNSDMPRDSGRDDFRGGNGMQRK